MQLFNIDMKVRGNVDTKVSLESWKIDTLLTLFLNGND